MTDIPQKPDIYKGWFETESAANTDYPPEYRYNHTMETPRGHSIELDDTPGRERIRISHRANSFIEIDPEGKLTYKAFGDIVEISLKDKNVKIKGDYKMEIEGDCNINIKGDKIETIEGNYELHVLGHQTSVANKTATFRAQNDLTLGGGANLTGTVRIDAGDAFVVSTDLVVKGAMTARNVTSLGRIDAALGVSAGVLGFVTEEGGIQVGPGVAAVPLTINCTGLINAVGPITSEASVAAPDGLFGIMAAGLMTDMVNTKIYDMHVHKAPDGATSPPAPPMV